MNRTLSPIRTFAYHFLHLSCVAVMMISVISCKKKTEQEKKIKQGTTMEVGLVLPEIRERKNDTVKLALYPHARFFFIDLGLKNSEHYLDLIKKANKADMPVRVKVYESNPNQVAEIFPPTPQDLDNYRKSKLAPAN